MDRARYAQKSDPTLNKHLNRRWRELPPAQTAPSPTLTTDAEPGMATLTRWVDEWRARRAARSTRRRPT